MQDVERMGDVLRSLDNVDVTLAVLRESKVGATVSKLKKHANDGIANTAKALVKKWKRIAEAQGVQGGAAAGAGAGAATAGKSDKSGKPSGRGKLYAVSALKFEASRVRQKKGWLLYTSVVKVCGCLGCVQS